MPVFFCYKQALQLLPLVYFFLKVKSGKVVDFLENASSIRVEKKKTTQLLYQMISI
jgi:hypothetical protein